MHNKTSIWAAAVVGLAGILAAGTSNASPIVFSTGSGASTSGGPVSASASFALGFNFLEITLNNLLVNPSNDGQLLSGLSFSINGAPIVGMASSSGQEVFVAKNGATSYVSPDIPTGWVLQPSPLGFDLCDICSTGKGALAPNGLIIGPPDSNGVYSNANGSIAGNPGHNQFFSETATFTLFTPDLPPSASVSSVLFRFGTGFGLQTTVGECTSGCGVTTVPEPGALALFAAGLGTLGFALSRKRRRAARLD